MTSVTVTPVFLVEDASSSNNLQSTGGISSSPMNPIYHVTRKEDLPSILAEGLQPRIGPRSIQIGESSPAVYFFPDMESVENALLNWLGEEFDDDEIVVLVINPKGLNLSADVGFELTSDVQIDSHAILGVLDEDLESLPMIKTRAKPRP